MAPLRAAARFRIAPLCGATLISTLHGAEEAPTMNDILVIVLGTGAILLMAAYAELCGRI